MQQSTSPTVLAIYAHPDDEVLGAGGSLALAAAGGAKVVIVVATRGEAGEIQRPGLATPETLAQVREEEMRCSARALGASQLIFLNYRDSGMEGAPDNQHPEAFINAAPQEVVAQLVAIIRQLRPHLVITFEPYGGYGHPDHKAIHRHALTALDAAADENYQPRSAEPWSTPRLYYHLLPRAIFHEIRRRVAHYGGDTTGYDELLENLPDEAWPADQIHVTIDVSSVIEQKWTAWDCHRTQFGPNSRFRRLPDADMKEILSTEYFAMARPQPDGRTMLTALFS